MAKIVSILLSILFVMVVPIHTEQPRSNLANIVTLLKFDEGSGTLARNSIDGKNLGSLVNGATFTNSKQGYALTCDGSNDYMTIAGPRANLINALGYSMIFHINIPNLPDDSDRIFRYDATAASGYECPVVVVGSVISGLTFVHNGVGGGGVTATMPFSLGKDHVVGITWDGSKIAIYFDSIQYAKSAPVGINIPGTDGTAINFCSSTLGLNNQLNMKMDFFSFYDRLLSPSEVSSISKMYMFGYADNNTF